MDDATLVSRAVGGDREAFAAIYDRYAGAVLDLCTAVVRDGGEAAEATLDSFLLAAHELVNLRDRTRLRLWLLAVARHEATTRARGRTREVLPAGAGAGSAGPAPARRRPPVPGPDVLDDLDHRDLDLDDRDLDLDDRDLDLDDRDLDGGAPWPHAVGGGPVAGDVGPPAWDSSEDLSVRDRAILHLHLRHELDGEELGAVLGLRPAAAEARAARLRSRTEASVGALLLSRADTGADPKSCGLLAEVLEGWDGRFTPAVGARIDRHARGCDACRGRRAMLLGRLRAMASLPFLPPPSWLRQEVLLRMELAVSSRTLPGWDEGGFPPGIEEESPPRRRPRPGRRTAVMAGAAVAVLLIAAVSVGVVLLRDDGGGSTVTASGAPATSVAPSTTAQPATTQATQALTATTLSEPPSSTPATTALPTPSPPGPVPTVPLNPGPAVSADFDPPAISFGAEVASAYIYGCPYSSTTVSADVTDRSPVTWVVLFVVTPDGVQESAAMSLDGGSPESGRWRATLGDFSRAGQAVYWVEAADTYGNRSRGADQFFDVYTCE